ncbi:MAG: hypothetical protein FGF53_07995 [Candidatus Brockarchaeota archaeon]|nr:hypothetical protein [Candidatus Brockarchaeota archaeon]
MQRIAFATVLAIASACIVVAVLGALVATRIISSVGNIKAVGVGVYSDSGCTIPISYIDWGFLEPGSSKQFTIYVKNEGNVPIRLSMEVDNWNPPSASNFLTLSWNRQDNVLGPGDSIPADLTLSVSPSISGVASFSFDIIIIGAESA